MTILGFPFVSYSVLTSTFAAEIEFRLHCAGEQRGHVCGAKENENTCRAVNMKNLFCGAKHKGYSWLEPPEEAADREGAPDTSSCTLTASRCCVTRSMAKLTEP